MKKKILFLFGTRPEAIKMAPLIKTFLKSEQFETLVAVTAQHREMLDQVLDFFEIKTDFDLNVMQHNQTLHELTANLIQRITHEILWVAKPDLVFVQGDTTSVLAGALASFYQKIPVAHIEAGLRSHDIYSPFPEEMNRVLTSKLTKFHFAPTQKAFDSLKNEGVTEHLHLVGNTVIDALLLGIENVKSQDQNKFLAHFPMIDFNQKLVLITAHRRENFGEPFKRICEAINESARLNPNVQYVYPVHLNPNIKENAQKYLTLPNIHLIAPLDYPYLIWLMEKSYLVLTDSGGIQEEAPSLGKPVLVLREVTERQEGVEVGTAFLVGNNVKLIISELQKLLQDSAHYNAIASIKNPYGDGTTSQQVLEIISKNF